MASETYSLSCLEDVEQVVLMLGIASLSHIDHTGEGAAPERSVVPPEEDDRATVEYHETGAGDADWLRIRDHAPESVRPSVFCVEAPIDDWKARQRIDDGNLLTILTTVSDDEPRSIELASHGPPARPSAVGDGIELCDDDLDPWWYLLSGYFDS